MENISGNHMNDHLTQFNNQLYLNLETYRKNGEAMRTPVWYVQEERILFVRTIMISGKVKRIRNNPDVKVVPCAADGQITGLWVGGHAGLVDDPLETARIDSLFNEKYGDVKKEIDEQRKSQGLAYATIAVEV
jgi:PPOX class probable F420-dependent enzyme